MPQFPMGFGGERMMSMVRSSLAPSTWTGYGKVWEEWLQVVDGRRVDVEDQVCLEVTTDYLLHLREGGASTALAQRRLTGIGFHFKLRGWVDVTKNFLIRQALKGWRRERVGVDCRRPVSYALLVQLLEAAGSLCSSAYEVSLFRSCFCLACFAGGGASPSI